MKFIRKIYEFIKKLFKKEKTIIDTKVETSTIQELETMPSEEYNDLYNQIKVGDIIWAKRYSNQKEKEEIPEGHQEGPFIVLSKEENNLICSQGSSVTPLYNRERYFYLDNEPYYLDKNTYFRMFKFKTINQNHLIRIIDTLTYVDLKELLKMHNNSENKINDNEEIINLEAGTIININKKTYVIIDIDSERIKCIRIPNKNYKEEIDYSFLKNLDFSRMSIINRQENIYYINSVNNTVLIHLLKEYKEYLNYLKKQGIVQRGSLVHRKGNKDYYIYGEEGQDWLTFKINRESNPNPYLTTIKIKKNIYYTDFQDIKINKSIKLKPYYLCTEKEIDYIKERRKNYKTREKNRNNIKIKQRKKN